MRVTIVKKETSCEKKIFKMLALSKIIQVASLTNVLTATIELLNKVQKWFLQRKNKSKIKHDTPCNDYKNVGLKSVDIFSKTVYNVLGLDDHMMQTFIRGI